MNQYTSWTTYGLVSRMIAMIIKPRKPTILVLSLPRSGSSWVGETLDAADDAMYLREPMNQTYIAHMGERADETVFAINPGQPPISYLSAARAAFLGVPSFSPDIVKHPRKWSLSQRRSRRVVIKEINPLACEFFLRYKPRVIFIIRHPAGVLLSFQRLGWLSTEPDVYHYHGRYQGNVLRTALNCLQKYSDHKIFVYENLCNNPISVFKKIFNFAGLTWTNKVEKYLFEHTTGGNRSDLWSTHRESKSMIKEWKEYYSDAQLNELRDGFQDFNLPWFQLDEDW